MKMFSQPLSSFFILIILSLYFTSCMSPVKKGFKHLNSNELSEATTQFKKAEDNKTFGPAAKQGLLEVEFKQNNDATLDELFAYKKAKEENQEAFKKLGYKGQSKVRKKGGFQVTNFRKFNKELQVATFQKVEESDRVLALDSFLVNYPRPDFTIKKSVDTLIRKIFIGKIKASKDYVEYAENVKSKKLKPGIQLGAIDFVENTNKLLVLDTFLQYFPLASITDSTVNADLSKLRFELVEDAVFKASDYATISSLYHNHDEMVRMVLIEHQRPGYFRKLNDKLIGAFVNEYEFKEIEKFITDHPKHYVSKDCWTEDLIEKAEEEETISLIRFLINHTFTSNDFLASNEIYKRHISKNIKDEEKENWTKEEVKMFEAILTEHELSLKIAFGSMTSAQIPKLKKYLEDTAPRLRSFHVMHSAIDMFWEKNEWNSIMRITKFAQPLYPQQNIPCRYTSRLFIHRDDWFAVVKDLMKRPNENISAKKFKPGSNSRSREYNPVLSWNEKLFVHSEPGIDSNLLVMSPKVPNRNEWMSSKNVSYGEPLSITGDNKRMLIKKGYNDYRWIRNSPKGWKEYSNLPPHIAEKFRYIGRVTLLENGRIMIFSACKEKYDLYRGGNYDLFVSRKTPSGEWGAVIPLKKLNTNMHEISPFIHADGETLYFYSNDIKKTAGRNDIFVSRRLDDTWARWSEPINLGKETNNMRNNWNNQYHIDISGDAYFVKSSDYAQNINTARIPSYAHPKPVDVVTLLFNTSDETIPRMRISVKEPNSDKTIRVLTNLPDNRSSYILPDSIMATEIHVVGASFFPIVKTISQRATSTPELIDVELDIITVNTMLNDSVPVPLQNAQFEYNSSDLNSVLQTELTVIADWLKEKSLLIEISGHTDNKGSDDYNLDLSDIRAKRVRDYFVSKGIPIERLKFQGYGASKPIASNESETGRNMNRRIEVRLKKKKVKKKVKKN